MILKCKKIIQIFFSFHSTWHLYERRLTITIKTISVGTNVSVLLLFSFFAHNNTLKIKFHCHVRKSTANKLDSSTQNDAQFQLFLLQVLTMAAAFQWFRVFSLRKRRIFQILQEIEGKHWNNLNVNAIKSSHNSFIINREYIHTYVCIYRGKKFDSTAEAQLSCFSRDKEFVMLNRKCDYMKVWMGDTILEFKLQKRLVFNVFRAICVLSPKLREKLSFLNANVSNKIEAASVTLHCKIN